MSNSFFDFGTALPSLGSGKAHDYDQELLAPPDDIDQLNDETFGEAAIEGDWEEQHKRLAEEIGTCRRGDDFSTDDFFSSGQKEELETSLTHLVDDEEPEPHYQQNGQPIPGTHRGPADVDHLFGPSSPPGLLNTDELVGGHQNIWGSPVRDSYIPRQEDGLKTLLKVLQSPKTMPVAMPQHQDPSIVTSGRTMPPGTLPNARTLAEIEHGLIAKKNGIPIRDTAAAAQRADKAGYPDAPRQPVVRTLEEIEQELTGHTAHKQGTPQGHPRKAPSPPQPGFPFPIGTPPQAAGFMSQSGPGAILSMTRPVVPPPMPTPGQLSKGLNGPQPAPHPLGSSPQITILQRNTPPPGIRNPPPGHIIHAGTPQGPKRTSPVFMVNQGRRRVMSTPSPTSELTGGGLYPRPQASSPTPLPPLARLASASPDLYKANLCRLASSPITQGILHGMLGTQGDMAGSPGGPRSAGPPRRPPDRPISPLEGTPFMPRTPQNARMPVYPTHSDPSHHRGQRGGHYPNQSQGNRPRMYGNNKNSVHDNQHNRDDDHHNRYPDHRHGDGHFRGGNGDDFSGPPRGRGDYNHHGNRGDFNHRGGDYNNHRGGWDFRGDFPRRGRGDFNYGPHRGRGDGDFHHRGGYNRGGPPPRGHDHHGYHHRQRYNSYGEDDYEEEPQPVNKDSFAGLMSKKEKDWVIKIQLMQLQTENPYLDDYYYTRWAIKRMMEERQQAEKEKKNADDDKSEPKLVIPHLARVDTKGYKPVQFENSLGRVTASSVHNPRQIIDIKRTASQDHEDAKAREVRRYKELLLQIEQGYDLLLDVDDLEKKALGLPEDSRPALFEERHSKIQQLFHLMASCGHDGLYDILLIRKGIKLMCRLLPLIPTNERRLIVSILLQNLTAISKKDWQSDLLPSVYQSMQPVVQSADLQGLVEFTEAVLGGNVTLENGTNTILSALQNKFGSSVIWCLLSRGENIYATESPVDMELSHQEAWSRFVSLVASTVGDLSKDQLAEPRHSFPSVPGHVERLVDKRTYVGIEDKLAQVVLRDAL